MSAVPRKRSLLRSIPRFQGQSELFLSNRSLKREGDRTYTERAGLKASRQERKTGPPSSLSEGGKQ